MFHTQKWEDIPRFNTSGWTREWKQINKHFKFLTVNLQVPYKRATTYAMDNIQIVFLP